MNLGEISLLLELLMLGTTSLRMSLIAFHLKPFKVAIDFLAAVLLHSYFNAFWLHVFFFE